MTGDDDIISAAATWHVASEGDAMDWDGFTAWLEADPRHRAAYDEIALGDAMITAHSTAVFTAANDVGVAEDRPVRRGGGWRTWGPIALAASLAMVVALPFAMRANDTVYATGAQAQTVRLPDGSTVALAPHSRLSLEDGGMTDIALDGGAMFDIRHDPNRAMAITAGGLTISDIGTRFDVQAVPGDVRIAVAQGEVHVSAASFATPVRLPAGQALSWDRAGGHVRVGPVVTADVGSWQSGRLSYDGTPLALVAQDLSRYAGIRIVVAGSARDRPFSGTLSLEHGDAVAQDLAQLMGLPLAHSGDTYRLGERAR
jgi:transmembrane sensor